MTRENMDVSAVIKQNFVYRMLFGYICWFSPNVRCYLLRDTYWF